MLTLPPPNGKLPHGSRRQQVQCQLRIPEASRQYLQKLASVYRTTNGAALMLLAEAHERLVTQQAQALGISSDELLERLASEYRAQAE